MHLCLWCRSTFTKSQDHTNSEPTPVIDKNSTTLADAWATALYASPKNEWLNLAKQNNLNAYFIYEEDEEIKNISTSSWYELVE